MRSIWPRKVASALMRAPLMAAAPSGVGAVALKKENRRLAHLFMICSNIKLTGRLESIELAICRIHERNQEDSSTHVPHHPRQRDRFRRLAQSRAHARATSGRAGGRDMGRARPNEGPDPTRPLGSAKP